MKHLILVRHAKSSWSDPSLRDHDRPLNNRGLRDAPRMGKLLHQRGVAPDTLVSSTAVRALTTARLLAKQLDYPQADIQQEPRIYEAGVSDLFVVIRELDDAWNQVALFGHNPGFTYLANTFKGQEIVNVPTCGIVQVRLDVAHWAEALPENGTVQHFFYPKMLPG